MGAPVGPMDGDAYEDHHSFVWKYGSDVVGLLEPRAGERILDLGCGGGQLTASLAEVGADVTGVDVDPSLVARAEERFPDIRWVVSDLTRLDLGETFDAVFSNATLHWIDDPVAAASVIAHHLRPGGRFVAEFGGATNVEHLVAAIKHAHPDPDLTHPWYFPTEAEYVEVLESVGLIPEIVVRFRRPTVLEGGPAEWVRAFGAWALDGVEDEVSYLDSVEEAARPTLWKRDHWEGDYVRLRVLAHKPAQEGAR